MKTLLMSYNEQRDELQHQLDAAKTVEQAVKIIQDFLYQLERQYVGNLTKLQIRLARPLFEVLRLSINGLTSASETDVWKLDRMLPARSRSGLGASFWLRMLEAVIYIGFLVGLVFIVMNNHDLVLWGVIAVVLLLCGLRLYTYLYQKKSASQRDDSSPPDDTRVTVRVDSTDLLRQLEEALITIEQTLFKLEDIIKDIIRELSHSGLEAYTDVLELLQNLAGAALRKNAQLALAKAEEVSMVLDRCGIKVVKYQPTTNAATEAAAHHWFEFVPDIHDDAKGYTTLIPALIKAENSTLLLPGQVAEPLKR